MFVKSSLSVSPGQVETPSFFFDRMAVPYQPMQVHTEVESTGRSGIMHISKLGTPPGLAAMCSEGNATQTERQETGSDASTADTSPYMSPYVAEECFYADVWGVEGPNLAWNSSADYEVANMAWHGAYPSATGDPFGLAALHQQMPQQQQPSWADSAELVTSTRASSRHCLGQCKPCAFAWKPEGCQSGAECKFCHFCPPGEKQRRKRVLRTLQRTAGLN